MSTVTTRSLFEAAREDAMAPDQHDAMWERVAGATGIAAGAASAAPSAGTAATKAAGFGGAKLLALGGIIGAVSTALGVLVTVFIVAPEALTGGVDAPTARTGAGRVQRGVAPGARLADPSPRVRAPAAPPPPVAPPPPLAAAGDTGGGGSAPDGNDGASDLAAEARLVTQARAALVAGDPKRALALVQATRRLSTRALEPEELGLEARALSALGRADEAAATDFLLRRRYPDSALAR